MNTDYEIIDEYGYENYEYLNDVLDYAIKYLDIKNSIFDIIFIDDTLMKELNNKYRNINSTTDVLSFALNDNKHIETVINTLGSIYISIPKMKSQAVEYNHSEKRELSFLALHGFLHLLGYDHMNKEDEEKMFSLQRKILDDLGI